MSAKTKANASDVRVGSGNVFADIGLPNPEEHQHKAELATEINAIINRRGLTQVQAAKLLEIDQPRVSDLARGKLGGFSIDRLIGFLTLLDQHVEIIVSPARKGRAAGLFVIAGA